MGSTETQIIAMLADLEMTVSKLYKIYAKKYVEHSDFWDNLVKEEENHARLIKTLGEQVKKGTVKLNERLCNKESIEAVSDYVRKQLERIRRRTVAWSDALTTSLQIEKNVIEKDFCSFFVSDTPEFRQACETITSETAQHRDKLRQLLDSTSG